MNFFFFLFFCLLVSVALLIGWRFFSSLKLFVATIESQLFDRVFIDSGAQVCAEGIRLPKLPDWLNAVREDQLDTRAPGVFLVRPSLEHFRSRFVEMMGVLEAIGVEMGVVKVKIPEGWFVLSPQYPSKPPRSSSARRINFLAFVSSHVFSFFLSFSSGQWGYTC